MSTEIESTGQFVNPTTGEALSLSSPDADLGNYLADIRELESVLREHKQIVTRELLSRMDRSASWTVYEGGLKLSGSSPKPSEEWDGVELYNALWDFIDSGELSPAAVEAAVAVETIYKPQKRGIEALRKLGGDIAETIDGLAREVVRDRRITVSRNV